jgi:hypothetical protein
VAEQKCNEDDSQNDKNDAPNDVPAIVVKGEQFDRLNQKYNSSS